MADMTEIKARTTMYKGIKMRSRLEADFAAFLDQGGLDWDYEPVCFAGPDGQWLPDFGVTLAEQRLYIEIKPDSFSDDDWDPTLTRMSVTWLTEPDAILQLMLWPFGDPDHSVTLTGSPHEENFTWWYAEGSNPAHAWPGMGQLEECIERVRREAEEAGKSS